MYQAHLGGGRFIKNKNGSSQKRRGRSQKEGILTELNVFDRHGDRLLPKSLDNWLNSVESIPGLLKHDSNYAWGIWRDLRLERNGELKGVAHFIDAYTLDLVNSGSMSDLSIGFEVAKGKRYFNERGGYDFGEVRIFECSATDSGAHPSARFMKQLTELSDVDEQLNELNNYFDELARV